MNGENITDNSRSPLTLRCRAFNSNNKEAIRNSNGSNIHNSPFLVKKSSKQKEFSSNSQIKTFCSENINNNNNKVYTPSPNNLFKTKLSDRFIPVNNGINLLEKFEIAKTWEETQKSPEKQTTTNSYSNLLQNSFFGANSANKQDSNCIKSKIFEYKTEQKKKPNMGFESILENCQESESYSRKINSKPYKILEAPGLIDDFYLNLVDWSSNNDIAVGLNNSVYLWCANKTQVVNLLNYTGDKYVSSVIWNN